MYANRVDVENVFDEETYYLDRNKRDFMYKNIRFGGYAMKNQIADVSKLLGSLWNK